MKQKGVNMIEFVIKGTPRTKKNSSQIIMVHGRPMIIPSKAYKKYESECGYFIPPALKREGIKKPINLKVLYFMPSRRKIDLNNLLEATTDILVHYGVLEDDNRDIVASHDGSRVYYDKNNPRCEISINYLHNYEQWKK